MSESKDLLITKLDDYSTQNKNNFVAEGEITVTITLNEYRQLIKTEEAIEHYQSKCYILEKDLEASRKDHEALREKYNALYKEFQFLKAQYQPQPPIDRGEQNNV